MSRFNSFCGATIGRGLLTSLLAGLFQLGGGRTPITSINFLPFCAYLMVFQHLTFNNRIRKLDGGEDFVRQSWSQLRGGEAGSYLALLLECPQVGEPMLLPD